MISYMWDHLSHARVLKIEKLVSIYIYRRSASRFSRETVLNTLKQSRINIMRGKKIAILYIYIYIE